MHYENETEKANILFDRERRSGRGRSLYLFIKFHSTLTLARIIMMIMRLKLSTHSGFPTISLRIKNRRNKMCDNGYVEMADTKRITT